MRTTRKAKPTSAFAKIDAKRKRYTPDLEGYGTPDQWRKNFSERIGFEEAHEEAGVGGPYFSVVSQIEIFALGGERSSGYWSHRQCDAQIMSNLTVQRRLKLF